MNMVLANQEELKKSLFQLDDRRSRHIIKQLKLKTGSSFTMGILNQSLGRAVIESIGPQGLRFNYRPEQPALPPLPLTLIIGAVRPLVMKRLLRDCTAFGCQALFVFNAENGEKSYLHSSLWQQHQWRSAVWEGLELAKAVTEPQIKTFSSLKEALEASQAEIRIALDPSGKAAFAALQNKGGAQAALAVGSERGFTANELALLQTQAFRTMPMGRRIVRSETACAMGLALTACAMGFFN